MQMRIRVTVNDKVWEGEVAPDVTLLRFLRERLALTGTKEGCGIGECGACTVLVEGRPMNACMMLAVEVDGAHLRTIEGEARLEKLTDLQQAFVDEHAIQCGFCTPGMVLAAQALLERDPHPDDEAILEAIGGNLCRCTGYASIVQAIKRVAKDRAAASAGGRR